MPRHSNTAQQAAGGVRRVHVHLVLDPLPLPPGGGAEAQVAKARIRPWVARDSNQLQEGSETMCVSGPIWSKKDTREVVEGASHVAAKKDWRQHLRRGLTAPVTALGASVGAKVGNRV